MPETAASQRPESVAGVDLLPRLREIRLATVSGSFGAELRPGVGYDFHELCSDVLATAFFALLGLLSLWGALSSRLYSRLSQRYARVDLLDLALSANNGETPSPFVITVGRWRVNLR